MKRINDEHGRLWGHEWAAVAWCMGNEYDNRSAEQRRFRESKAALREALRDAYDAGYQDGAEGNANDPSQVDQA